MPEYESDGDESIACSMTKGGNGKKTNVQIVFLNWSNTLSIVEQKGKTSEG